MRRNDEYMAIKSLDELRRKIVSNERELLLRERKLREDYEEVSKIFTLDYQVERSIEKFNGLRKSIESMVSGANVVTTFIESFRERMRKGRTAPPEQYSAPEVVVEEVVEEQTNL